jgi:cytochrome c biogenesis factor
MNALSVVSNIQPLLNTLQTIGAPFQWAVVIASVVLAIIAVVPPLAGWRRWALGSMTGLLLLGEVLLAWFHFRLYQFTPVVDPSSGLVQGHVAVSLWVEGERLYIWALMVAILGLLARRERDKLLSGVMLSVAVIATVGVLTGSPFTNPLPGFLSQYSGYIQAMNAGGASAQGAFQGMESTRQFFYNAWFMWVHPPLLYFSYGAFTISFVAAVQMVVHRHSRFETAAYRWARLGYLALTVGMLLGFPWALEAWTGEAWWWSGFVNMSIMMWVLYTAYLHARLYLRRQHMWRAVAALALLSFAVLVLTYVATYVVPGAHSYAAWAPSVRQMPAMAAAACRGGARWLG